MMVTSSPGCNPIVLLALICNVVQSHNLLPTPQLWLSLLVKHALQVSVFWEELESLNRGLCQVCKGHDQFAVEYYTGLGYTGEIHKKLSECSWPVETWTDIQMNISLLDLTLLRRGQGGGWRRDEEEGGNGGRGVMVLSTAYSHHYSQSFIHLGAHYKSHWAHWRTLSCFKLATWYDPTFVLNVLY